MTSLHDLPETVKRVIDLASVGLAGVAAFSWANAAFMVTVVAGLISIVLGLFRLHDRLKYGPPKGE